MKNQSTGAFDPDPLIRFFERVADVAKQAADELRSSSNRSPHSHRRLDDLGLGSLQLSVAEVLRGADDNGLSPRQVTAALERGDEPNVRTALTKLEGKGVAELCPGAGPQRWRLAAAYRSAPRP